MEQESNTRYDFSSRNLLSFAWKKRVPLVIISVIAVVASVIVSLLITPKYESTVVLFPTTSVSVSEALVSASPYTTNELLSFGGEEEVERILQILYSDIIRERLVQEFDLFNHYRIDPDSKYRNTELYSELDDNISFRKTEFMSIEIKVRDADCALAADMANEIASLLNSAINHMQKKKAIEAFEIVKKEFNNLEKEIAHMEDSFRRTGSAGLQEYLKLENARLSQLKGKYLQAKVDAEQNLPHTFVVSRAYPAEKKAYPKRSVIVVVSTLSTFLLALFVLALVESLKLQS